MKTKNLIIILSFSSTIIITVLFAWLLVRPPYMDTQTSTATVEIANYGFIGGVDQNIITQLKKESRTFKVYCSREGNLAFSSGRKFFEFVFGEIKCTTVLIQLVKEKIDKQPCMTCSVAEEYLLKNPNPTNEDIPTSYIGIGRYILEIQENNVRTCRDGCLKKEECLGVSAFFGICINTNL